MITNLFSIFDPCRLKFFSLNWGFVFSIFGFFRERLFRLSRWMFLDFFSFNFFFMFFILLLLNTVWMMESSWRAFWRDNFMNSDFQWTPSRLPADSQQTPSRFPVDSQETPSRLWALNLESSYGELFWESPFEEPI